jgi:hypothetical protein
MNKLWIYLNNKTKTLFYMGKKRMKDEYRYEHEYKISMNIFIQVKEKIYQQKINALIYKIILCIFLNSF